MLGEFPLNESDLFPEAGPPAIEAGIIGWEDQDDVADMGDDSNGGVTLIRVQLFRGKDATSDVKPGVAQGHRILARMNGWPIWAIPPKGLQCYVMFPSGFGDAPGAGVIAGLPGANPFVQFSKTRAKLDMGEDQDLVLKARSITLSTYGNDYIVVGPDTGIRIATSKGHTIELKDDQLTAAIVGTDLNVKTCLSLNLSEASLICKSAAPPEASVSCQDGSVTISAKETSLAGGAVTLGAGASPATPVLVGSPPGVPSSSVFSQS